MKMNWTGGARNRSRRVNIEQKKQKEFFERRKLANISRTAVPVSTSVRNSIGISRDILHLQCVSETKRGAFVHDSYRASRASPDMKSQRARGRTAKVHDYFGDKRKHVLGRHGDLRKHRERLHLPNASPIIESSKLDLADASDVEVSDAKPFRHLPSYQSTPMDGFIRSRLDWKPRSSLSGRHAEHTADAEEESCLNTASSTPILRGKRCSHELTFSRLDETIRGCELLILPNAVGDRSEKKVNFSNVNEYHSLSEESLSDRYSVVENFLHNNENRPHSLPRTEFDDGVGNPVSGYDKARSKSHGVQRQHGGQTGDLGRESVTNEFLQEPDFTPIKKERLFWPSNLVRYPMHAEGYDDSEVGLCQRVQSDATESLTSWLRSKGERCAQDRMDQSLAVTPGLQKECRGDNRRFDIACVPAKVPAMNCGSSGEVIVIQDEDIPGLESGGPMEWQRIKMEQGGPVFGVSDLTPLKSEETSEFPWIINNEDGLHCKRDGEVEMAEKSSKMTSPHRIVKEERTEVQNTSKGSADVSVILSEVAGKLTQSDGDTEKEGILPPVATGLSSHFVDENRSCSKRLVDKACSPIQAILPKVNREIGLQTSPLSTKSVNAEMRTTVGTQTGLSYSENDVDFEGAREPFVMLGNRVGMEEELREKSCGDPSPSQSSTDDSVREEKVSKRRRSKRLKQPA